MKAGEENTEGKINEKTNQKNVDVTSLVSSAPSSSKIRTVTAEIQETINKCTKRSNSYIENKYKCTITSERLAQLRKIVENATRDHKVFSIKGKSSKMVTVCYMNHLGDACIWCLGNSK